MIHLKSFIFLILIGGMVGCRSQQKENGNEILVGGPCQGCEAIYQYGDRILTAIDTVPGYFENEPKLKLTGTVFEADGKTPAKDVILYIYQTDRNGIYDAEHGATGWASQHGKYRGWIQTGTDGRYTFYTFRPAAYPSRNVPEHIHLTVKEPDKNEYYMEDYFFEDDPLLTASQRRGLRNRGGSGIVQPVPDNGIMLVKRNLYLGLNIPDYK